MIYNSLGNTFSQNLYANQLDELKRQIENLQNTAAQPLQPLPAQQIQQIPQIPTVHGYEGMKTFFVPASGSVVAFDADSSDDKLGLFVKMVDANGIATIKAYDAYERTEPEKETETQYVLKSDFLTAFDKLAKQLSEVVEKLNNPAPIPIQKDPALDITEETVPKTLRKGGKTS